MTTDKMKSATIGLGQHLRPVAVGIMLAVTATLSAASDVLQAQGKGVHVCVSADRTLRYQPGSSCPSGQTGYQLAEVEGDVKSPDEDKAADREIRDLKSKIEFLTERVAVLERGAPRDRAGSVPISRVFAPFEVLDKSGNAIFRVTDRSRQDEPAAAARVLVSRGGGDNFALSFRTAAGGAVASIGQAGDGSGGLFVNNSGGTEGVRVFGSEGVVVSNKAQAAVVRIGAIASGAGYLIIGNPSGSGVVEAGWLPEGRGVVRTYPTTGKTPIPVPSFIMGGSGKP